MSAFAEAARSLGLDPFHMLRRAGLPVAALDHPDYQIPADRVQALLADSAKSANSEEFGLLVGRAFKLSMKGPLGLLMREQADVRAAVDVLRRYLRYQNDYVEVQIQPQGAGLMIVTDLVGARTRASRQMTDMTVAMYVQIFRGLLGEHWMPARVALSRPIPKDLRPYRELLGAVEFEASSSGFLMTSRDLGTRLGQADPYMAREIARYIEASAAPQNVSSSEAVTALITRLLPEGACSIDRVAQHLGVDRRTVHRRLAAEGKSFTQLLEGARRDVATWQLSHGDQPLTEVTALVGFSSLSTFSRWFRSAYGMQPSEFRRLAQTGQ
ncbi:MAG TPA: AraC family transcriptional regulator [Caulobacteraceae bacterium]|nr:AraC family transcriptional regulator [Caulobacteraceae bacterium]